MKKIYMREKKKLRNEIQRRRRTGMETIRGRSRKVRKTGAEEKEYIKEEAEAEEEERKNKRREEKEV